MAPWRSVLGHIAMGADDDVHREPSSSWRTEWTQHEPAYASVPPPPHPTYDLHATIRAALDEDAGDYGDITTLSTVPETTQATATFLAKAEGTVAGLYVATVVFGLVDPAVKMTWQTNDGDQVKRGQVLGVATGPARAILVGERVALNYLQRMSGIATQTHQMVEAIAVGSGSGCCKPSTTLLDTRKTVPGLRLLDKWAVKIGGGENHRMGLYDMVMIKDNHHAAAGGIPEAILAAEAYMRDKGISRPMEVETRTLEEVKTVLDVVERTRGASMVTRIMLDNMVTREDLEDGRVTVDTSMLEEALAMIRERGVSVETEASGNVTLATVGEISKTGVQFISTGSITHSVTALDISLLIDM